MTTTMIDVLVVGAGPVGTAMALDLTRRGLTVRIIDKTQVPFGGSRAKGVQPRSMEVLEDLGVLDDVIADGADYPSMGIHLGPVTVPLRMMSPAKGGNSVPFHRTWLIPQKSTDRALRTGLAKLGIEVEYGRALDTLTQTADAVEATVTAAGGEHTIVARYLVGADGAGSVVRKQAGIEFVGETDDSDRILIVDAGASGGLSRNRWHVWPRLRGGFVVGACPLPHSDQFQWMIRLAPGEQVPAGVQGITDHIRKSTRNTRLGVHDITWTSVFRPNIRLAQRFRRGRVFVAGDAAHVHPPTGAQGLNTGVQDAYNLGWKIAQVIAGASDELLDTYEEERRPIAAAVLGLASENYSQLSRLSPSTMSRGADEQQLTLNYRGGPLAPTWGAQTTTLRPGDRAPDAVLCDDSGGRTRIFDHYRGPHFTAVAYGDRAAKDLEALPWPTCGAVLHKVAIDTAGRTPLTVLRDNDGAFRRNYGIGGRNADVLILIRPDGYIASIATQNALAVTAAAAGRLTPPVQMSGQR